MKAFRILHKHRSRWWATLLGVGAALSTASAADTNAPAPPGPQLTPEQMFEGGTNAFTGWLDLSAGGFLTGGNEAQAQQQHHSSTGPFGGIEDLHFQGDIAKGTTFTLDGRSIFDNHDYDLSLGLSREKLGYLRFSFSEFRTWYNGDGGFFAPTGLYFPGSDDALGLDRGQVSFEGGLTLEKMPQVKFKYTHTFRDGDKSSTSWGLTHPGPDVIRGLSPTSYDINEHSDSFQLDVTHHIKATEFGAGFSYESGKLDNAVKIDQFPGEPVEQKITDKQGTSYDLFNAHAFTETWIKKDLFLSTGFSFSDLDNTYSGSRIYGTDFDVNYVPSAQSGLGYYGLNGGSRLDEYVMDVNLMAKPWSHFSIVPSVRVLKEDSDANFTGIETLGDNTPGTPFSGNSNSGVLDVRERLDATYNGFTNWVLYARCELTEGDGNLKENGGLTQINSIGVPPIQRETDDDRFFQKYSFGARWYPLKHMSLDVGGYYKLNDYDYSHSIDSTPNNSFNRYPAYLVVQNFETYDGNIRLTLRPVQNVTTVTRNQDPSTIHTRPDGVSGLAEVESSKMNSHIIAQDVSWSPWSRLFLQVGFNYVLSDTRTPTSDFTQSILKAQNNYWTLSFSSGLVLDDKTDLNLGYFFYQADNYVDNSTAGVPLGAGGQEHGINATITRRLSKNLRLALRYGYYHYDDETFGGHQDFYAHVVSTTLRYRF